MELNGPDFAPVCSYGLACLQRQGLIPLSLLPFFSYREMWECGALSGKDSRGVSLNALGGA